MVRYKSHSLTIIFLEEVVHLHVHVSTSSCPMASTTCLYIQRTSPVNTRYHSRGGGGGGGGGGGTPLTSNGEQLVLISCLNLMPDQ